MFRGLTRKAVFWKKSCRPALGDAEVRVCERGAESDCCRGDPCKRANEFERAGYRVQIRAGHGLLEPGPPTDGVTVVLVAEPTVAAFAHYEDELRARGRQHSVELLQYWLANDALSRIDFWRKWTGTDSADVLVLRIEGLLSSPRNALQRIFAAAGVEIGDGELDAAERAAADLPPAADVKSLEASPHFARPCFVEYTNLLAQEANYLGYPELTGSKGTIWACHDDLSRAPCA